MNPFENYRITSPYGWRMHPVYKERRFHTGIDLVVAPSNGPLYAFTPGEVVHASEGKSGSGFGNMGIVVAIQTDKHLHVYAHLSLAVVKVGQKVDRGQMIGRQGSTGVSTGPHLHYEIRKRVSPSFGWVANAEDRAFEPTQYLIDYFKAKEPPQPPPKEDAKMKAEDANRIITLLQGVYNMLTTKEEKKEIGRLADELRAASGQPKQNK